jgi:hypothetical protein
MVRKYKASKTEIAIALESFVRNDYCIVTAAKETGVKYATLCKWVSKHYIYKQKGKTSSRKSKAILKLQ